MGRVKSGVSGGMTYAMHPIRQIHPMRHDNSHAYRLTKMAFRRKLLVTAKNSTYRGVEKWHLARPITLRSRVRIPTPQPTKDLQRKLGVFCCPVPDQVPERSERYEGVVRGRSLESSRYCRASGIGPEQGEAVLKNQLVPLDESLWHVSEYPRFLEERRKLIANAINEFLAQLE